MIQSRTPQKPKLCPVFNNATPFPMLLSSLIFLPPKSRHKVCESHLGLLWPRRQFRSLGLIVILILHIHLTASARHPGLLCAQGVRSCGLCCHSVLRRRLVWIRLRGTRWREVARRRIGPVVYWRWLGVAAIRPLCVGPLGSLCVWLRIVEGEMVLRCLSVPLPLVIRYKPLSLLDCLAARWTRGGRSTYSVVSKQRQPLPHTALCVYIPTDEPSREEEEDKREYRPLHYDTFLQWI